jgi:hypothetical protein
MRKCSISRFLPRTPSAFQHVRRWDLHLIVFLGRVALFGHVDNNGLQHSPRAGSPCGEGGNGCEESKGQLQTCLDREVVEEIRDFLEWGGGRMGGDHQFMGCGFRSHGFDTRGFLL